MAMYELTVTPKQLAVIQAALEDYFRTRMGQYFDLTCDLAGLFEHGDDIDHTDRCSRRDAAQSLMNGAYQICHPPERYRRKGYVGKSPEMMIAEDIWAVIRHERWKDRPDEEKSGWTTDSDEPLHLGPEPPIKVRRIDDAGT